MNYFADYDTGDDIYCDEMIGLNKEFGRIQKTLNMLIRENQRLHIEIEKIKALPNQPRILRVQDTEDRVGLSRPTIYRLEAMGKFPKKVKVGPGQGGAVGWLESEVSDWIMARVNHTR